MYTKDIFSSAIANLLSVQCVSMNIFSHANAEGGKKREKKEEFSGYHIFGISFGRFEVILWQ